jgi:hypothetical protein
MTPDKAGRCWRYGRDGCRAPATNSVRIGAHVYRWCTDPAHDPRGPRFEVVR